MRLEKYLGYSLLLLPFVILVLGGCQSTEEDVSFSIGNQEVATTFTAANSSKIQSSIFDLPGSITTNPTSTGNMMNMAGEPNYSNGGSNDMSGIFSGVTNYVSTAEMFKDFVKQLMANIVGSGLLQNAELDTIYDISEAGDNDGPQGVMIQKPTGEAYEWKVSLYFDASPDANDDPGMIARFTLSGDGARGRILWETTEVDEDLAAVNINLNVTRYIDITFDGTSDTKSLELKYVGDLSNFITYAQANWDTMSAAVKDALDIGQPGKVFLTAQYDSVAGEYTLYATSYHPGWAVEASLDVQDPFWGSGRSMYMFKVKAIEGSVNGAKLFLALPLETTTTTDKVWTDDALGALYTSVLVDQVNGYTIGCTVEDSTADNIVTMITGADPTTTAECTIDATELTSFVDATDDGLAQNVIDFKNGYRSISYIINPALFEEAVDGNSTFLGTYDQSTDTYYQYSNNVLSAADSTADIADLLDLDLSGIEAYVPSEVKAATITVQ